MKINWQSLRERAIARVLTRWDCVSLVRTKQHPCYACSSLWHVWKPHLWAWLSASQRLGNIEFGHLKAQDRARPQQVEKQKEVIQLKQVSRTKTWDIDLSAPSDTGAWEGGNSNISCCRFNPLPPQAIIVLCLLNLLLQYHSWWHLTWFSCTLAKRRKE